MPNKYVTLFLTSLAQFMVVVDIVIVNVALPTIQRQLYMSQSTLQWVVIAYGLLFGSFLLLGGRLGDILGRRRVLLVGLTIFTVASLSAGLSHTTAALIVSRAIQGFGAALIAPSALSILAAAFTEGKERNNALGVYGAVGGLAATIGVLASGILTNGPGWRWIFYINIPVGVFLIALAARILPRDVIIKGEHHLDANTAVAATSGLLLLIYAMNRGTDYGWTAISTLGLFAAAAAFLGGFLWLENRSEAPLVLFEELRKNRTMRAANLTALLAFGGFFGFIFLTTLFMQQQLGYSALHTGLAWLFLTVSGFFAAGLTGAKLAITFGTKPLLSIGLACITVAALLLARTPVDVHFVRDMLPAFLLGGIAIGLTAPSIQISALTGATHKTFGFASGFVETMRELGSVLVIASISTVLVSRLKIASLVHDPAAHRLAALHGFHAAYIVVAIAGALGLLIALTTFGKSRGMTTETSTAG
jgi:EmrB/QacA subfamily drug resistance transporter